MLLAIAPTCVHIKDIAYSNLRNLKIASIYR
uniref:Uncharacterized protein n=1 Tax=Arundo donax TaxID=35708 RepID=A0A0A9APL3_ARUDO